MLKVDTDPTIRERVSIIPRKFLINKRYIQTGNCHIEEVAACSHVELLDMIEHWNEIGHKIWEISEAEGVELKS
jgi:hypothetical protein